jgi:hypothetical protein
MGKLFTKSNVFIQEPEALKSLYRSPGYKKNQLVLCLAVVVILELRST